MCVLFIYYLVVLRIKYCISFFYLLIVRDAMVIRIEMGLVFKSFVMKSEDNEISY